MSLSARMRACVRECTRACAHACGERVSACVRACAGLLRGGPVRGLQIPRSAAGGDDARLNTDDVRPNRLHCGNFDRGDWGSRLRGNRRDPPGAAARVSCQRTAGPLTLGWEWRVDHCGARCWGWQWPVDRMLWLSGPAPAVHMGLVINDPLPVRAVVVTRTGPPLGSPPSGSCRGHTRPCQVHRPYIECTKWALCIDPKMAVPVAVLLGSDSVGQC